MEALKARPLVVGHSRVAGRPLPARGEEDKARAFFEQSYKMDAYNMRTVNQIKLLDVLKKFAVKESKTRLKPGSDQPAFIIKYQLKDEILASLAVQWMEKSAAGTLELLRHQRASGPHHH